MCSLLDVGCHFQNAIWERWQALGPANQVMVVVGVLLILGGSLWGVFQFIKRIGGWPAVAGAAMLVVVGVLSALPKKPEQHEPVETVDEEAPVIRRKPKSGKRTRTIFDQLGM